MFGILCIFACSINFSCFFSVIPLWNAVSGVARWCSIWRPELSTCSIYLDMVFCSMHILWILWTVLEVCKKCADMLNHVAHLFRTLRRLNLLGNLGNFADFWEASFFFWFLPFLPFCLERSVGEWQSSWLWSFRTHRWRHLRRKLVKRQSSRQRLGRDKLTQSKNKVMERHNVVTCQRMKLGKTTR